VKYWPLVDFYRDIGTKLFLLMDRATWHRSNNAKEFNQKNKQWLKILLFNSSPNKNLTEFGRVHESLINSKKRVLSPYLRKVYRVYIDYGFQQLTPTTQNLLENNKRRFKVNKIIQKH
jgi:hypothetical protein